MKEVELPDGRILTLTGNETPEQLNAIKQKIKQKYSDELQKPSLGRTLFEQGLQGATAGFEENITDPLAASYAALIQEPKALITGEIQNSALREQVGSVEEQTQERLLEQREKRPYATIGANIVGSLATGLTGSSTKAGAALGNMLRSGNTAARVAKGSGAGAAMGGLYGAGMAEDDIARGATEGAISGGLVGGVLPAAGASVRALTPKADEGLKEVAKLAQKHKIPLSVDQITDSRALNNIQKVSQELPFSGQEAFRDGQMKAFNRALLRTVGQDGDNFSRTTIDKAFLNVGRKFDKLGKGNTFEAQNLARGIREIADDAPEYATDDAIKILNKNIDKVIGEIQDGTIKGEKLNMLRSRINSAARKTKLPDAKDLLKDLENVVVETLAQGDDAAVREAKKQYKNLLVLEPLLAKAKGGNISPTQLTNRVNRIYGRQFVRGGAGEMGELADVGRELLPELGGSDTAQKLLYYGGAGLGATQPGGAVPVAAGLGANRAMQSLVNRNQALIRNMTKEQQKQLMSLPPSQAQKVLDSIKYTATQSPAMAGAQ